MDEQTRAEAIGHKDAVDRWRHIFEILGLDSAAALYPALGLNPAHAASWREASRVFLTHYHTHIDQCEWEDWQWNSWNIDTGEAWVRAARVLLWAKRIAPTMQIDPDDISLPPW